MKYIEKTQCRCDEPRNDIVPTTYTVGITLWIPFNTEKSSTPLERYSDTDVCFKRMEEEKCDGKLDGHPSTIHVHGKEPFI